MPYVKGRDGKPRTINNPLEGAVGNIDLVGITTISLSVSGNVSAANLLTDGYRYANGVAVNFGGSATTTLPAGNITYTEANPADWPIAVANVQGALDTLANVVAGIETGTGFSFAGPYSNDSAANAGGVAIGQVYFNNSGGLVVRQT